jgi:hypothetical protein
LSENESERANLQAVPFAQSGGLADSSRIQVRAIAAAQVNEPEFLFTLNMYSGMAP